MPVLPPTASPRAALADLRAFLSRRSREQAIAGALAFLITTIIIIVFLVDATINTAPPRQIIYTESWSADRTDAEIIAQQKKDQALREQARAARRAEYQKLQKQLGIE
ncbi:hypothetical protein ACFQPG_02750 [Sphingomonas sp. GCM10030256]|uniref:hypothetical protein n=1 Tax=Sphingomonas sp. GCM10030256 TaxID=3273427 RepID=UPI003607E4E1